MSAVFGSDSENGVVEFDDSDTDMDFAATDPQEINSDDSEYEEIPAQSSIDQSISPFTHFPINHPLLKQLPQQIRPKLWVSIA